MRLRCPNCDTQYVIAAPRNEMADAPGCVLVGCTGLLAYNDYSLDPAVSTADMAHIVTLTEQYVRRRLAKADKEGIPSDIAQLAIALQAGGMLRD